MPSENLRELFVEHNVHLARGVDVDAGTAELEPNTGFGVLSKDGTRSVVFKKNREETVFLIGEEGENIVAVSKSDRVLLPLPRYAGGPEHVEAAIQDRLLAVIEAVVINTVAPGPYAGKYPHAGYIEVPADQVYLYLAEKLGSRGFSAILTNTKHQAEVSVPSGYKQHPFYSYKDGMLEDLVIGLGAPKYVGHIVTDADVPDEAIMTEDGDGKLVPWEGAVQAHVGILALGGIVGVKIKR